MSSYKDEQRLKELVVLQALCNNDLLFFTRYFFKLRFHKPFVVNPHHRIICEALNRVMEGDLKRLIINIYPRSGKTELAVINNIANGIGRNPMAKFIHLSYSDDLVLENSEAVRDIISLQEYQAIYGDLEIKKDSRAKKNWKTVQKGGLYAAATGGQVTGFGAGLVDNTDFFSTFWEEYSDMMADEFMDEATERIQTYGGSLIIDDPIKPEDAKSDLVRESINKRFDTTISNRVNSRNTPIVLMGQRTAPFDLSGHLLNQENHGWEHLVIPARLTPDDMDKPYKYMNDDSEHCEAPLRDIYKYDYDMKIQTILDRLSDIPTGKAKEKKERKQKEVDKANRVIEIIEKQKLELDRRDIDFPMWRFKFRLDELEREEDNDPVYFGTQYQQDPKPPEGLMYPKEWMTWSDIPEFEEIRSYTDVADEGSDYLCSIVYGIFMHKKYVLDIVYTQSPTEITEKLVSAMHNRWKVDTATIESNNGGKIFARNVERFCREDGNHKTSFNWFYQTGNKNARITNNSSTVQNTLVMPADWAIRWKVFYRHLSNYMLVGKNKYDDCADCVTGCIEHQPIGDRWADIN